MDDWGDEEQCGHPCEMYFAMYGECDCTIYGSYAAGQRMRDLTSSRTAEGLPSPAVVSPAPLESPFPLSSGVRAKEEG